MQRGPSQSLQSNIPTCHDTLGIDCALGTDIIIESAEGKQFGCHKEIMQQYGGFMPSQMDQSPTEVTTLKMVEDGVTLVYLLQFMHHTSEQPSIRDLPFSEFAPIAYAVEKYMVEAARQVCVFKMEFEIPSNGLDVFLFAAKHGYKDLLTKAAIFTVDEELTTMRNLLDIHTLLAWMSYREEWVVIKRKVWKGPDTVQHSKGFCDSTTNWDSFYRAILDELDENYSNLTRLGKLVNEHLDTLGRCPRCFVRTSILTEWSEFCQALRFRDYMD